MLGDISELLLDKHEFYSQVFEECKENKLIKKNLIHLGDVIYENQVKAVQLNKNK